MNTQEMKNKFWEEVLFVTPEEIKEDSIGIVSDDNVDSLIDKVRNETIDEFIGMLEKLMENEALVVYLEDTVEELKELKNE